MFSLLKRVATSTISTKAQFLHYHPKLLAPQTQTSISCWWDIENNFIPKMYTLAGFLINLKDALKNHNIKATPNLTIVGRSSELAKVGKEMMKVKDLNVTVVKTEAVPEVVDEKIEELINKYIEGKYGKKPDRGSYMMIIASDQDHVKSMIKLNNAGQVVLLLVRHGETNKYMKSQAKITWDFDGVMNGGDGLKGTLSEEIPEISIPPKKNTREHKAWKKKYNDVIRD